MTPQVAQDEGTVRLIHSVLSPPQFSPDPNQRNFMKHISQLPFVCYSQLFVNI